MRVVKTYRNKHTYLLLSIVSQISNILGIYMKSITDIMVLDIEVNTDSVKKLEKFLGTGKYKDLVTNTKSFSRKINEERKMRLPYVCGQVINPFK